MPLTPLAKSQGKDQVAESGTLLLLLVCVLCTGVPIYYLITHTIFLSTADRQVMHATPDFWYHLI